MPLTQLTLNVALQWALARTNSSGAFNPTTQGVDSENFTLLGVDLTTFNQFCAEQFTIASSASQTVDLTSITNLVCESVDFAHVLTLMVLPVGSQVTISPGASNSLQWFFGGTTQSVVVNDGGVFLYSEPVDGPGAAVSGSAKTLEFTNSGGSSLTLTVLVLGGTS